MSTKSKHRAKKVIFIMLGVSSIATLGLVASHHFDDQANNDFTEPNNDVDHSLNSNYVNDGSEAVTSQEVTNLKENSKGEDNLPPPDSKESKNKVVASMIPNIEKYQKVSVIATGYTAGIESTGKTPSHPEYGITYSGVKVRRDTYSTIAADIHIFPLGTILYIPGYGYGVVADIGSAIKGNKIDLYYETVDEVYQEWGKKQVEVYLIKLGNGRVTESLLDQYNNKTEVTLNTEM